MEGLVFWLWGGRFYASCIQNEVGVFQSEDRRYSLKGRDNGGKMCKSDRGTSCGVVSEGGRVSSGVRVIWRNRIQQMLGPKAGV